MEVIESSRKKNTLIFRLHQRAIEILVRLIISRRIWKVVEKIIMKKLKERLAKEQEVVYVRLLLHRLVDKD
jgi:hypothetical protein